MRIPDVSVMVHLTQINQPLIKHQLFVRLWGHRNEISTDLFQSCFLLAFKNIGNLTVTLLVIAQSGPVSETLLLLTENTVLLCLLESEFNFKSHHKFQLLCEAFRIFSFTLFPLSDLGVCVAGQCVFCMFLTIIHVVSTLEWKLLEDQGLFIFALYLGQYRHLANIVKLWFKLPSSSSSF